MPDQVEIRPLSSTDVSGVVTLWNQTLTAHPITQERFNSLFFSDVTGIPKLKHSSFVAVTDQIVGVVIAYQRNLPAPGLGLEPELGYLTAVAIAPSHQRQGIGSKLLKTAIADLNANQILLCGRTGSAPAATFPGIDLDNYPAALEFFLNNEFIREAKAHSMSREINSEIKLDLASNIEFVTEIDPAVLYEFASAAFPGDWADVAIAKLNQDPTELAVVTVDQNYAGFAVWNQGWFGPIGVAEEFRKYGLGSLLVENAINNMYSRGIDRIWFNWADEWVVPFYQRLGFVINRNYQRMKRTITKK
ncbi:MAG: GNAT family N-acetyltransferase [Candidatus Nanopelagicales bacterium]